MTVGIVGVGLMGHGIARNVMRKGGFTLGFLDHPGNQPVDELIGLGATRHDSRDAGGLREAYLARLAQRRDWLREQARGAGWHFGHHATGHAPAHALSWLYQVLGG